MNKAAILLGLTLLAITTPSPAQTSRDTTGDAAFFDAVQHLTYVLQGASFDKIQEYISEGAVVILSDTTMRVRDLLAKDNRQSLFHEDSRRQGVAIDARSNESEDAAFVVLKTLNAERGDPHYHSFTLYKEPAKGWQLFLWHVGG